MKSMYIGSGDVGNLMAGITTKSHANLLRRFVSDEIPYFNAKASPIDALRAGAILEERYLLVLDDSYYPQVRKQSEDMDVFRCSLDFAKIENSKIVDFEELKTVNFDDFLNFEIYRNNEKAGIEYVKKSYKKYYNQLQEQLYCTGLESATMVFLAVYSYDDEVNYTREIQENEFVKFRIPRDEKVIAEIKERGQIFQTIKDTFLGVEKKPKPKSSPRKVEKPKTIDFGSVANEEDEKEEPKDVITPEKVKVPEKAGKAAKKGGSNLEVPEIDF